MINDRENLANLTKKVFKSFSYEIFQYLEKNEKKRLSLTNKFFLDLVDCHYLFDDSMQSLNELFQNTIEIENSELFGERPKSKLCMYILFLF